jgi:hypothetical protein
MNLSVDSLTYTDELFAEEMRNCTQSPADRVLVNVNCSANVFLPFAETEHYESEKPVMRGVLNYAFTNEEFKGKLIHSIAKEMGSKLLAEKQWSCVSCVAGRSAAFMRSIMHHAPSGDNSINIVAFPTCLDPLCLIGVKDYMKKTAESMHGKKIAEEGMHTCICGKLEVPSMPFERCSQCHTTYYCSRECQRVDWKKRGHKQACRAFVALKNKNA